MCKVLMIAGIKKETSVNAWKFIKAMTEPMSKANKDGLGYAAITADGKLFGERWLTNSDAFSDEVSELTRLDEEMFSVLGDAVDGKPKSKVEIGEYNSFGDIQRDQAVAVTLHTRYATAPKGMQNTHPFVDQGVSLIHNGMIRNAEEIGLKISTCDSEAILRQYIDRDVQANPKNFQDAATLLEGYYACGVLTNTSEGPIMDIFKGNHASLYVTKIKELDTYVLSTSDDDIKAVCKELGFTTGDFYKILEGKFIRVNAVTSKNISITPFNVGTQFKQTYSYPQATTSGKTTRTSTGADTTNSSATVYPLKSHRKNTPITSGMMDYFKAGKFAIHALSEHEVQEEIMKNERMYGSAY